MYNKICKGVVVGHVRGEQSVHKNYKDMFVGGKVGGRKQNVHEKSKRMFIGGKVRGKKQNVHEKSRECLSVGRVRGETQNVHEKSRECLSVGRCEGENKKYTTREIQGDVCRGESVKRETKCTPHTKYARVFVVGKVRLGNKNTRTARERLP